MTAPSHVINNDAIQASITTFISAATAMFSSAGNDPLTNAWMYEVGAEAGQYTQQIIQDFLGNWQKLQGARETSPTRLLTLLVALDTFSQVLKIRRKDIQYDKSGTVAQRINIFLSAAKSFKDQCLHDQVLFQAAGLGITGADGVLLFSASHPFAPAGGVQANTGTPALSDLSFNTAYASMTSLVRENGEPFRVKPMFLVGGPTNRVNMLQITQAAMRGRSVAATGLEAAAAVVASAGVTNVNDGIVQPLIDERLVGARAAWWYLLGEGPGGSKPIMFVNGMAPKADIGTPTGDTALMNDEITYYLTADASFAPWAWQTAFFSNGTT